VCVNYITTPIRDWLRVVSINPETYELRYYNIQEAGDESDSEDED